MPGQPKNLVIWRVFSNVFALTNTDKSQICVAVSKWAGTDSRIQQTRTQHRPKIVPIQAPHSGLSDFETFDAELPLLTAVRWSVGETIPARHVDPPGEEGPRRTHDAHQLTAFEISWCVGRVALCRAQNATRPTGDAQCRAPFLPAAG
jgi:hypothetical protein